MTEHVILVNEENTPIGTAPKATIHTKDTPLHRGFSVFLFRSDGQLLLQQRSRQKKTWPLIWSNSCCGHPALGESTMAAAQRRFSHELNLQAVKLYELLPDYRYRTEYQGIVENEFCPVLIGFSDQQPNPNPNEIEALRWVDWTAFVREIITHPDAYSAWCVEETQLLDKHPQFAALLSQHTIN